MQVSRLTVPSANDACVGAFHSLVSSFRLIPVYYAATLLFAALDFGADVNVRVAFLEGTPAWRIAYYVLCAACFALVYWRPTWAAAVAAFESLANITGLILDTGIAVLVPDDLGARGFVSVEAMVNFVLSGSVAYWVWQRRSQELFGRR